MAEKGVLDCDKVGAEDTIELTSSLVKRSYDSTEMKIIEKINEQYLQQINEVERLEGDLEDPSTEIKAVKLKNKILKEWNQKFQQTIRHLCEEMTEAESILGEKYEMLMKHVENMEKLPQMVEKEQKEILKEINAIKAISSDENIGDTKNVSNLNGTTEDLLKKIEELIEQKEHLQEENQKLSKIINSIKEGDSLLSSRTERLEQENEELKARIAELESLSKRSSLSLLDKIEFNNVNTADSGVADEFYTETLSAQSAVDLYSSTSSTLKDFPINQNEEYWTLFLKKLESSLKIDIQEYLSANINSVEKLWKILESRIDKCERVEKVEAEVQVDIKNQLSSSVQNLSEIENNVVIMLETIDKHNTGLPLEDIRLLLSEFDEFLTTIQKSIASKITTKIMKNGDVETTGFVDIPESKFKELLDKFKSHEKSINQKITQKNAADMHQFRKQIVSLCVQIEHLRDQIQDKNYYQNENKVLLKKIDTLEKKIQTLNGTITKTFNSLASSDLLEDKKRTELQQAFKMSEMIGITLAIQSIGVAMRNEIFAASVQSEKSREEVRMLTKKIEAKEKEKDDIIKNTEHTRVEMDEMKRAMNTLKMTEEESRQMKKYLQSIKVELIHLLETRNHHSGDGTDSSGGGSSITSDFESMSLSGLMNDLKREIITKEEVLKSRQIIIDNLELCLSEMKRHMARLEQENHNFNKSNSDLSKKVIAVEKEKEEVEEKKQELDKMIADYQQQLETIKQEKQQLKFEHANQSQTISHLRRVLEETKRSGTATVSPSSSSSFLSTFFRSVHDV